MKCQEFEPIIISLARGRLVETAAREAAIGHLEGCARCAIAFEDQQALTAGIRVAAVSLPRQDASLQVEAALRRAFREQAGAFISIGINQRAKWSWRWSWRLVGWAAAIILFAFLAGVDWLKSPPVNQKQNVINLPSTPDISVPGEKQESQVQAERSGNQNQITASNSTSSRRQGRRHSLGQGPAIPKEVGTRFFPLVEEDEMAPLESGLLVRVEVPASTLISLGLPVTAESINRPVQADLLLGQDGLARAIRFLP